ncbi:MAG: PVC-type heme-binding CxxCH protein, partial [Bacteroidota bacterium]
GDQHDHGMHAFTFGMDGRLYFNSGNAFEKIADKDGNFIKNRLDEVIDTKNGSYKQGLAFRCELDGSNLEVLGHNFRNPYELAVDSYGSLWQSDNDDDGNRGTRINYVMQYGNYGYTDEMTGAGWRTRRIGMHDSIPKRHWFQNDPGSVPNLLQTGSGSPTGMIVYEGDLLPEVFQNQMIHCEPGHQVVRAYPVKAKGAGYEAKIQNLMKSKDPWFRPSDICVASDGSIFVADWYDPGVGGHKMGDVEKGRIYRIAPDTDTYQVPKLDLSTPENAVEALKNPNLATRYLAWMKLNEWGAAAEDVLLDLYKNGAEHYRARAFWLLSRIDKKYIKKALKDENTDIQLAALRAAQYLDSDNLLAYLSESMTSDKAALLRETALLLRYENSQKAAKIWTQLAQKYDGKDRWYLEALGIGADLQADLYFQTWLDAVGEDWNSAENRDIVWRMRSPKTVAMIAEILKDQSLNEVDLARYFRALHFHPAVDKDAYLAALLEGNHPHQEKMNVYILSNLSPNYAQKMPQARAVVQRILPTIEGTKEWLDAIRSMNLKDQAAALIKMALEQEDKDMGFEAIKTLIEVSNKSELVDHYEALSTTEKEMIIPLMGRSEDKNNMDLLKTVMNDESRPIMERQWAATSLANSWKGQYTLASLIEEDELSTVLKEGVALRLINCWPPEVKAAGFKVLKELRGEEAALPPLKKLVAMKGDVALGKNTFQTFCANCHQVEGEGIEFGPALSEIGSKLAKQAIYEAIFYPSAGINFGYEGYLVKTKDGGFYNGYISSETETELTLKMMGGISTIIPKDNIASREALDQSLMTAGLHSAMSQEDLVNLVEYLSSLKRKEQLSVR